MNDKFCKTMSVKLYVYVGIKIHFNVVSGKFLVCGELFRNQEQQKNLR